MGDYIIVSGESVKEIVEKVNDFREKGYRESGGVAVTSYAVPRKDVGFKNLDPPKVRFLYVQAMVYVADF